MAGCYGNSPEDRYYESMLYRYLDSLEYDDNDENEISEYQQQVEEEEYNADLRREEKLISMWEEAEKEHGKMDSDS